MNLLTLILIVLIITIEPFLKSVLYNGLVFIKPENLTKTELVEKFKELSSSNTLKDLKNIKNEGKKDEDKVTIRELLKSYYSKYLGLFSKFYGILTKMSLLMIFLKYMKKIKLIRFVLTIINSVLLSMFGIVFSDVYGFRVIFEYIKYYWIEYVEFVHETKMYKILVKIFTVIKEEDINSSDINKENSNNSGIIGNKETYDFPSSHREIETETHKEIKSNRWNFENIEINKKEEVDTPFYQNKYFLIGLFILSFSVIYIYWDSILELFKNVKPDDDGNTETDTPKFLNYKEEYEQYFIEKSVNEELYDLDVIRSQNRGKIIDYIDVEKTKWEDSNITPKASTSKLPETQGLMLPISKK